MPKPYAAGRANSKPTISAIAFSLLGAVIGAVLTLWFRTGTLTANMSYADLAATLLAAVGVIVAIFGGVLAIAAFWGFHQMKQEAVASATAAAIAETKAQIESGIIRTYILEEVETRISEFVASPDFNQRVRASVDQLVYGNPEDRLLEADGDDDGGVQ